MRYWRSACWDDVGNFYEECEMTEEEMQDYYEWHKDEFFIPHTMTLEEFVRLDGFTVLEED